MKITKADLVNDVAEDIKYFDKLLNKILMTIEKNPYLSKDSQRVAKVIIEHQFSKIDKNEPVKEVYDNLEKKIFDNLSAIDNYDDDEKIIIKLFEGISIEGSFLHEREKVLNFKKQDNEDNHIVIIGDSIKIKPHVTQRYKEKINNAVFNN